MAQCICVFLQAAGVLLLLWALIGWLLCGQDRGGAAVLSCLPGSIGKQEAFLRYYLWLREIGILQMPLYLVDCGLSTEEKETIRALTAGHSEICILVEKDLAQRMRTEASQHGGTGTAAG